MKNVNQTIVETFREVAEYLETGRSGRRPRLLLTGMGSEHGEENSMQAAVMAAHRAFYQTRLPVGLYRRYVQIPAPAGPGGRRPERKEEETS